MDFVTFQISVYNKRKLSVESKAFTSTEKVPKKNAFSLIINRKKAFVDKK